MDAQETIEMDVNGYHVGIVFQSVVMSLAALVGIGGNILFIVLICMHKHLKTYTNYLYMHRALADICFLAMVPFYVVTIAKGEFIFGLPTCWVVSCLVQCGILASNMFLIPIGIHSYLCGKQQKYTSNQRSLFVKVAVRSITLLAIVSVIGVAFTTKVSDFDGVTLCVEGPLFSGVSAFSVLSIFIVMMVPLIGVWIAIVLIYTCKHQVEVAASPEGETNSEESQEEDNKHIVRAQQRLLVALAVAFTLCQFPFWVAHMFTHVVGHTVAMYLLCIFMSLMEINMALNPILYFWHGKDLLQALRGCFPTHAQGMVPLE